MIPVQWSCLLAREFGFSWAKKNPAVLSTLTGLYFIYAAGEPQADQQQA